MTATDEAMTRFPVPDHDDLPEDLRKRIEDETERADVGSVAAFFNLSNRLAHLADMRPNPEFYDLGRDRNESE